MTLHRVRETGAGLLDDVFTAPLSEQPLPTRRIPEHSSDPRIVYELLDAELRLDGNATQNLATFCTTWIDHAAQRLMRDCYAKNLVDKDEYPQTAEIESRCVQIMADLWNAPGNGHAMGTSTTGSSEAAMLAGLALKWRWRAGRRLRGEPADRPNLVCGPVQVCWEKFARYFDVELRRIPIEED